MVNLYSIVRIELFGTRQRIIRDPAMNDPDPVSKTPGGQKVHEAKQAPWGSKNARAR